jgi:hypothetical protein
MRFLKIESLDNKRKLPWYDVDGIMLHACFQLLKNFIENESHRYISHTELDEYDSPERIHEQNLYLAEAYALYYWWKHRSTNLDFEDDQTDQAMLKRLIDIRLTLWT